MVIMMNDALKKIKSSADKLKDDVLKGNKAELEAPVRSLNNVIYNKNDGFFELKGLMKKRTLTANTVKTFAQTLRVMSLSKSLIETEDIATKREAYYVSKNWDEARFKEQNESDAVMDDIEAMFSVNREQLGFIADEHGGSVAGELVVIDKDPNSGEELRIDCTRFGSGAYSIPSDVEHLRFETKAKSMIVIETNGMFERLNKHGFWRTANCIIVSMGGVPTRACRRFIRRLSDDADLDVFVFTDGDPYGYLNIYRTLKVGSGNAAHINEFFCVPRAKFLGITPDDIADYKLPTHPLKDVDIKRIKDGIKNDPFVHAHKSWQDALSKLMKNGKRAEQQALAKHGLNFVVSDYLPEKLKKPDSWLD
ncbi:DNA topoisomerase IV subunit A [Candidatus Woesearchaeota archaeon]|nr:DNA topoisomerase IV subunit A [Candidatus Woesearchaeota archaeon]